MAGICHIKNKERGIWFEIKSIAEIIKSKEAKGLDASYERNLLESWSKHEGYEGAKQTLAALNTLIR